MAFFVLAFIGALGVALALASVVRSDWQAAHERDAVKARAAFALWAVRGLAGPLLALAGWNALAFAGPPWGLEPLAPQVDGAGRWGSFLAGTAAACLLGALAWAVVSEAWLLPAIFARVRQRRDYWENLAIVGGLALPLALFAGIKGHWASFLVILAGGLWLGVRCTLPLVHRPNITYSRAIARMKFGDYAVAEQEVLAQLEEKEDDFAGWMMLAELYARNFGQLGEADRTVRELCLDPHITALEISSACNRLANWHLELGSDPAAARRALEEVVRLAPDTAFARSAQARIRQLPLDVAELQERRQPRAIPLPALREDEAAPVATATAKPGFTQLAERRAEAARLNQRLEARPEDAATRLRLARLLAEQLGNFDGALAQLRHLRADPEATPAQRAEWLSLEAAWELKLRKDEPAARRLLGQLVREHPATPQAVAARRQLQLLEEAQVEVVVAKPPPRIVVPIPEGWSQRAGT